MQINYLAENKIINQIFLQDLSHMFKKTELYNNGRGGTVELANRNSSV